MIVIQRAFIRIVLLWERPLTAAFLAFLIYFGNACYLGTPYGVSKACYFNFLADAFLHGQLHLQYPLHYSHDISTFEGKQYLYWPPMPAVLMIPWISVFGVRGSDIFFTILISTIDVFLLATLIRVATAKRIIPLSRLRRGVLVLFFACGTVFLTLAPRGNVWLTAQIIGFLFITFAYLAAITLQNRRAFLYTGAALGAAFLTRHHLLFNGLWPFCYLVWYHRGLGVRRILSLSVIFILPIVVCMGLMLSYNWLRFGSALETGLSYHNMSNRFRSDVAKFGFFSVHYLWRNVFYQYIAYPLPIRASTLEGGSLFLLSPLFFGVVGALINGKPRASVHTLMLTIFLVAMPILLLMGTGWVQFGPRYTLDFTVPLLLLTAIGIRRWKLGALSLLLALSVAHYVVGTIWVLAPHNAK